MTITSACSNDAAVGDASDTNAAGTGSAAVGTGPSIPAPLPVVSSITTQIRAPKVKEEGEERAGQSGGDHVDVSVGSLELMQATVQERDSLKEQVDKLTCELRSVQSKLQELSAINVKKESSHQASQTDEAEEEKDYETMKYLLMQELDQRNQEKEDMCSQVSVMAVFGVPRLVFCICQQIPLNDNSFLILLLPSPFLLLNYVCF